MAIQVKPSRPTGPLPRRRSSGWRRRQRRARRRRRILQTAGAVAGLAALATAGLVAAVKLPGGGQRPVALPAEQPGGADAPTTFTFATFDEKRTSRGASLVFVLAVDPDSGEATVLFVPTTTLMDIPGHGLDGVGRAFAYGGGPLLDATIDNLLGVDFDAVVGVSRQGWAALFGRAGGLTVDLPEQLRATTRDGTVRVRFEPGRQHLDGPRLAELMTFAQAGERDLDRLPRAGRVLVALFDKLAADPRLVDAIFADGAPMLDASVPHQQVRAVLAAGARAAAAERLEVLTLPVSPLGSGGDGSLRLDAERARALVADRFADSVPTRAKAQGRRLQILNGNGQPGVGQQVAELLVPAGFKVVLTDNADSFVHKQTRILVYDDDPAQLALAREVQRRLRVGRVQISQTPQSVVDITIVVGADLPSRRPGRR